MPWLHFYFGNWYWSINILHARCPSWYTINYQ